MLRGRALTDMRLVNSWAAGLNVKTLVIRIISHKHLKRWRVNQHGKDLLPWKLTCPLERDYFSREYIFQPLIFMGQVSCQGGNQKKCCMVVDYGYYWWLLNAQITP